MQALTLLNNDFILKQAEFLAERIGNKNPVDRAYDLLYGREPTERERQIGLQFLSKQPLAAYCRVLLNSNEFVYVP